jgi:VanZ family protein
MGRGPGVGTLKSWFGWVIDLERRWRWWVWGVYLVAWTTALIAPVPETPGLNVEGFGGLSLRMLVAKTVHVCAYALLAALTGWLRVAPPRRLWLLFFLTVHATATEIIQLQVVYRTGQLTDVALDQLGIALGMLCTWRWWRAPAEGS